MSIDELINTWTLCPNCRKVHFYNLRGNNIKFSVITFTKLRGSKWVHKIKIKAWRLNHNRQSSTIKRLISPDTDTIKPENMRPKQCPTTIRNLMMLLWIRTCNISSCATEKSRNTPETETKLSLRRRLTISSIRRFRNTSAFFIMQAEERESLSGSVRSSLKESWALASS